MPTDIIVEREGWIFLLYTDSSFDQPILFKSWYPTGVNASFLKRNYGEQKIGMAVRALGNGCYQDPEGLKYGLLNLGATKPAHFETEPIPCPKVRKGIPTRYRNGYWQKYLKTSGWTAA